MTLDGKIRSILFASNKPLTVKKLAKVLGMKVDKVDAELKKMMSADDNGIVLVREGDRVQLATSPETTDIVDKFVRGERVGELTRPSLETLTIIVYRGPVTKAELEMIRGVNCSLIIRNLMIRGLITEHESKVSEPKYRVSVEFLKWLGVKQASELPDYEKLSGADVLDQLLKEKE